MKLYRAQLKTALEQTKAVLIAMSYFIPDL
jgi:hypothetical protein